jgi:hypothetical protein
MLCFPFPKERPVFILEYRRSVVFMHNPGLVTRIPNTRAVSVDILVYYEGIIFLCHFRIVSFLLSL